MTVSPPATLSIRDLNGDWTIDKSKTENLDGALKLQGIGWLRRKAVSSGTITLKITQTTTTPDTTAAAAASNGSTGTTEPVKLMMQQGLRGIFPGVEQTRSLDWTEHDHVDAVSGAAITVQSRFVDGIRGADGRVRPDLAVETAVRKSEVAEYLGAGVEVVGVGEHENGHVVERAFVQDFISGGAEGWTAEQIWAVERIGEEVRLTCKAVAAKGSAIEKAVLVYQFGEQ
ncbi:hypothetical protein BJX68DRAFT_264836 [Aspergillus pseudodeflectus]|uniref:Uncharacterized protein n=1 Tax=Aspergillus pseudodeflectus TaxID=176178 RepID=A0ABR4KP84_9EURO